LAGVVSGHDFFFPFAPGVPPKDCLDTEEVMILKAENSAELVQSFLPRFSGSGKEFVTEQSWVRF
jgi:hypothetical protein